MEDATRKSDISFSEFKNTLTDPFKENEISDMSCCILA
jgi:hypothetical protein